MASHAPPSRMREGKATGRIRTSPAPAQRPRCLGAAAQLAAIHRTLRGAPIQRGAAPGEAAQARTPERAGLPNRLRAGVESLSGLAMDDVRVHRNSGEPAKLGALAFTRGSDIHLGPGQERHLPHEAWHVVQQKQGRVRATAQLKGGVGINDDAGLEHDAHAMGARALTEQRRPTNIAVATAAPDALQRKPVVQRAERDAIKIAAEMAARYDLHLNSMAEVMEEKYIFTAEEWQQIVSAYNAGGGGLRLRYSYDPSQYIGHVEQQIIVEGSGATTLERLRALAERYAVDLQARPGFYGRKVAKAAASFMVGLAATMVAGPAVGAMVGAGTGVALNSDALKDQAKLAQLQYASGDYRNALVTLAQLGLSVGSSAASATGHGHIAHVGTAANLVSGTAKKKLKTE